MNRVQDRSDRLKVFERGKITVIGMEPSEFLLSESPEPGEDHWPAVSESSNFLRTKRNVVAFVFYRHFYHAKGPVFVHQRTQTT